MPPISRKPKPKPVPHRAKNSSHALNELKEWLRRFFSLARCSPPLLVLVVAIAYSNSLTGEFLFDDYPAVVNNLTIRTIWPLEQSLWADQDAPTAGRPVVNFSFALNFAIGQFHVFGYHLVNVGLHAANSVLLFLLVYLTLSRFPGEGWWKTSAASLAFLAALLWSLHPLQTETVSYVTQRTELLMAFFLLGTLLTARLAWDATGLVLRRFWQGTSVVLCGMGMASKEVMVVAPLLVVLYDLAFLGPSPSKLFAQRGILYLGIAATWGILALLLAMDPRGRSVGFDLSLSSYEYFLIQLWAIVQYGKLAVWPSNLCGDYGVFKVTEVSVWLPRLILLISVFGLTIFAWFRLRPFAFLGSCFFLILAPTSSFVPIVTEPIAERRMYLPLAALITLFVVGLAWALSRSTVPRPKDASPNIFKWQEWFLFSLLGLAFAYGISTYRRNPVFQNEKAFWTDVVHKRPENARAHSNLGVIYLESNDADQAMACFQAAIAIDPSYTDAQLNLGNLWLRMKRFDESRRQLELAYQLDPKHPQTIACLGKWYAETGEILLALSHYDRALSLNPNLADVHTSRGLLLNKIGRIDEAVESYQNAIRLSPRSSVAYNNLGNIYFSQQRFNDAIAAFEAALAIDPRLSATCYNLGNLYVRQDRHQDALRWFQRALEIEPNLFSAVYNLGACYAFLGRDADAIDAFRQCVAMQPQSASSWHSLAQLYSKQMRQAEAEACLAKARELENSNRP